MKVVRKNPLPDAFAQAVWTSRLFLLRVPSECLALARQMPRGRMDANLAPASPAVIGLETGNLVIKLRRREHVAGRSRMIRQCTCEKYPDGSLEILVPRTFHPVRSLWETHEGGRASGRSCSPDASVKASPVICEARPGDKDGEKRNNWGPAVSGEARPDRF